MLLSIWRTCLCIRFCDAFQTRDLRYFQSFLESTGSSMMRLMSPQIGLWEAVCRQRWWEWSVKVPIYCRYLHLGSIDLHNTGSNYTSSISTLLCFTWITSSSWIKFSDLVSLVLEYFIYEILKSFDDNIKHIQYLNFVMSNWYSYKLMPIHIGLFSCVAGLFNMAWENLFFFLLY